MKNRTPTPRDQRPSLPAFTPVPRKCQRHDGWTPERQRAFIEALADTGSVATTCRMVNMASEGAYALRRHPQAASLAAAWDAALAMGWRRVKDEAFERALNGQLVPVFVGGKLMGYRRKKNDRLLMFILRHYGPDGPQGGARPLTVNVINASATAVSNAPGERLNVQGGGAAPPGDPAPAIASHSAAPALPAPDPREVVADFAGVPLDAQAQAELLAALEANAAHHRALAPEDDPQVPFIHAGDVGGALLGELESGTADDDWSDRKPGEVSWEMLGDQEALNRLDAAVADVERARAEGGFARSAPADASPAETSPTPALPSPDPQPDGSYADADWITPPGKEQLARLDEVIEAAKPHAAGGTPDPTASSGGRQVRASKKRKGRARRR